MTQLVSASDVRDYLTLNDPNSDGTSKYSDQTIGSNIRAAQSALEQATHRYLAPRTFGGSNPPWAKTTMLRAAIVLPGFRSFASVSWGGSLLAVGIPGDLNSAAWALPDLLQTGVYTGIQFRAFRTDNSGPWYWSDPLWWDKNLDSPFFPGNWGGGYAYTSMPNDLLIAGEAGYDPTLDPDAPGYPPPEVLQAIKVLASFYTMRPASILADVAITPSGGVLNYSRMPDEVAQFIAKWTVGEQMVSAG